MILRAAVIGHICADLCPKLSGDEQIIPGAIVEVGPMAIVPRRVRGEHRS